MAPTNPNSAAAALSPFCRFTVTVMEPMSAVAGCVLTLYSPEKYLRTLTPTTAYDADTGFLYTQLCGAWMVFAFNEAVVLRMVDDMRVWRLLILGMFTSDFFYLYSCIQAMGGLAEFVKLSQWRAEDWFVMLITAWPVTVRVLIVAGVGVRRAKVE